MRESTVVLRPSHHKGLAVGKYRINGVVVTWVVAIDPPGVRFPLNAFCLLVASSLSLFLQGCSHLASPISSVDEMNTPLPSGILEALQIAPGTSAHGRTFQEMSLDLTLPRESEDGVLTNKYDLLCPRGCRSVILKRGVGQLVERSGIEVRPINVMSFQSPTVYLPDGFPSSPR